jgi:hypothetical protein
LSSEKKNIDASYFANERRWTVEKANAWYDVGAINWELVKGKSNTIYAWDELWPEGGEPDLWFHDIFRPDASVYKQSEVDAIRKATKKVAVKVEELV